MKPLARTSIVSAVEPALTPVFGWAVFSDLLGPAQMLGAAIMIGAVVIVESEAARASSLRFSRREGRRIARMTVPVDVPAGTVLVRQGAPAAEFFVIERGRARVTRDGDEISTVGRGDFFGEVALLSGSARTASVIAAEDLIEGCADLAVAVVDQEAHPLEQAGEAEVTRLPGDPVAGRLARAARQVDASAFELDEEQNVEATERNRLDGEEV